MKKYIVGYALLALVSTALVQAGDDPIFEPGDYPSPSEAGRKSFIAQEIEPEWQDLTVVVKKADNLNNATISFALAQVENSMIQGFWTDMEGYPIIMEAEDTASLRIKPAKKFVLLASSAINAQAAILATLGQSLTQLRKTPNIEFKTIPSNCTTIVCTISQGRIGKLRIDVNPESATCTPTSRSGKAYASAKARVKGSPAGRYASDAGEYVSRKAGEAGNYIKRQAGRAGQSLKATGLHAKYYAGRAAEAAQDVMKPAGQWVKEKGQDAYTAVKKSARSAKRAIASGLENVGEKMESVGQEWSSQPE